MPRLTKMTLATLLVAARTANPSGRSVQMGIPGDAEEAEILRVLGLPRGTQFTLWAKSTDPLLLTDGHKGQLSVIAVSSCTDGSTRMWKAVSLGRRHVTEGVYDPRVFSYYIHTNGLIEPGENSNQLYDSDLVYDLAPDSSFKGGIRSKHLSVKEPEALEFLNDGGWVGIEDCEFTCSDPNPDPAVLEFCRGIVPAKEHGKCTILGMNTKSGPGVGLLMDSGNLVPDVRVYRPRGNSAVLACRYSNKNHTFIFSSSVPASLFCENHTLVDTNSGHRVRFSSNGRKKFSSKRDPSSRSKENSDINYVSGAPSLDNTLAMWIGAGNNPNIASGEITTEGTAGDIKGIYPELHRRFSYIFERFDKIKYIPVQMTYHPMSGSLPLIGFWLDLGKEGTLYQPYGYFYKGKVQRVESPGIIGTQEYLRTFRKGYYHPDIAPNIIPLPPVGNVEVTPDSSGKYYAKVELPGNFPFEAQVSYYDDVINFESGNVTIDYHPLKGIALGREVKGTNKIPVGWVSAIFAILQRMGTSVASSHKAFSGDELLR